MYMQWDITLSVKKNEIMTFTSKQMELGKIILS